MRAMSGRESIDQIGMWLRKRDTENSDQKYKPRLRERASDLPPQFIL
jgi:hypothetical protein